MQKQEPLQNNLFEQYNKQLYDLAEVIKQQNRIQTAAFIDEKMYVPNDTVINLNAQTKNVVKISSVMVVLTSAGTLKIGDRTFTLQAGQYFWQGLVWLLNPEDTRQLTQTSAGVMGLELMGQSLVNTGIW